MNLAQLKKDIGKKIKIVRAIPLPPISIKKALYQFALLIVKLKTFLINWEQLLK